MEEEGTLNENSGSKIFIQKSGFNSDSAGIHQAFSVSVKVLHYALVISPRTSLCMYFKGSGLVSG